MFINPKQAIENKWITHPDCDSYQDWVDRKYVCPNAIDFTVDQMFTINNNNVFSISNEHKTMRGGDVMKALPIHEAKHPHAMWELYKGSYDAMSQMYVNVPDGVACELIIRSSFSRNGLFLTSGLYDTGFSGHIGFVLHNMIGPAPAYIAVGTRIGQIKFVVAQNEGEYAGGYSHDQGTHWSN